MVTESSPSVITLTPCTIITLYHVDPSSLTPPSSACFQQPHISLVQWLRRLFTVAFTKPVDRASMALATSMRLSTPLPTVKAEEKPSNAPSTSSTANDTNVTRLIKYSQETEMKSYVDQSGNIRQYRQSTERALLAQRKIFLRKKLGEGSFSSVREGFDMFHQHKVAIKVTSRVAALRHRPTDWASLGRRHSTSIEGFPGEVPSSRVGHLAARQSREHHQDVPPFHRVRQDLHGTARFPNRPRASVLFRRLDSRVRVTGRSAHLRATRRRHPRTEEKPVVLSAVQRREVSP